MLLARLECIQTDEQKITSRDRTLAHLVRGKVGAVGDSSCEHAAIILELSILRHHGANCGEVRRKEDIFATIVSVELTPIIENIKALLRRDGS